jgi:hypothetical protein
MMRPVPGYDHTGIAVIGCACPDLALRGLL